MQTSEVDYDYRESHQDKGEGYVDFFSRSPRLRILWEIEKRILDEVLASKRFQSKAIRYLDFACGTARITSYIEDKVGESVGVDVSESMLAAARSRVRKTRLIHQDLTTSDLDTEIGPFDLITAFRFFGNAQHALRLDVMRVLSSLLDAGGLIVFNNHRRPTSLNMRLRRWTRLVRPRSEQFGSTMTDAQVSELLDVGGLRVVKRHHLGIIPTTHLRLSLPSPLFRRAEEYLTRSSWASSMAESYVYTCEKA